MAETGGPATAEMQPRPAGVVDRVKGKLREMFTPQGRAEVMAQKYAERVLAQVPEADRAKAMELLEKNRPELVEAYKGQAKGSLVRDAVIFGTGAVVVLGGSALVLTKSERARSVVSGLGKRMADTGVGRAVSGVVGTGKDKATDVVNWILRRKQPRDYGTKMAAGVAEGLINAYQGFSKKS